MQEIPVIIIVN